MWNPFKKPAQPEVTERSIQKRPRQPQLKRAYGAAQSSNLTSSWTTAAKTADQVVYQNLRVLRARSRDQFEGNDFARRFVEMVKTHVVGPDGFNLQATVEGRDGKLDTVANDAIEREWKSWQRSRTSHAPGHLHFTDFCRLAMGALATDGEVIIHRRLGSKYGAYQYALTFIDPVLLDVLYNEDLRNGHRVRFGIEYDEDDRAVAYYFAKSSHLPYLPHGEKEYRRVPAEEITHLYISERVGQRRGIPWLATPLLRMQMLDGYSEAAVTAARLGAAKAVFYRSDGDGDPDLSGIATLEENGQLVEEIDPASANILPPGVIPDAYDPTYPHQQFDSFVKAQLRSIAAGLGVSYHKMANDLEGVNYSSGRLGELEDRELWKRLQNWMIESFIRPLYEDWLALQLKLGTITVPTRTGPMPLSGTFDRYARVSIQGRRWEWTDPQKEANGNKINLDNYLTSPQRVLRNAGHDPEEIVNEWKKWRQMLADAGLPLPDDQNHATTQEAGNHADSDEND